MKKQTVKSEDLTSEQQMLQPTDETAQLTFEQLLQQLEDVVEQLSDEKTGVEEVCALYEKGADIAARCEQRLDKVEVQLKMFEEQVDDEL